MFVCCTMESGIIVFSVALDSLPISFMWYTFFCFSFLGQHNRCLKGFALFQIKTLLLSIRLLDGFIWWTVNSN